MPLLFVERIPIPSLRTYTTVSVLLFSVALYYAIQKSSIQAMQEEISPPPSTSQLTENNNESFDDVKVIMQKIALKNPTLKRVLDVILTLFEEPLCVWSLFNMASCVLILIGKCIQKLVFGELRASEQQHMKDKMWNFVFYKFIIIFGVMNVQYMEEVVVWSSWFSMVCAFHLLSQLCKDRFEYLAFSPTTSKWTHIRLFSLLFFILGVSFGLCTLVAFYANLNTFFFMTAEWALVILRTLYVLVRYVIHLYDVKQEGIWEKRSVYIYYSELLFELSSLVVDFLHHLHMLLWRNIFLSVASLVICMQLRCLINDIQLRFLKYKNYLRVTKHMENHYPLATREELEENSDDCAICWDRMETARKLPCGHMFHASCLHSWLEQVTNCPTCRTALVQKTNTRNAPSDVNRNILGQEEQARAPNQMRNHFFHFDGSRYVSWFPSFSVEVTHTTVLGESVHPISVQTSLQVDGMVTQTTIVGDVLRTTPVQPSVQVQLDNMVQQVIQMFPHMPYNLIQEDLLTTRSVEQTVENILEERLTAPQTSQFPPTPPPHRPSFSLAGSNFFASRGGPSTSSDSQDSTTATSQGHPGSSAQSSTPQGAGPSQSQVNEEPTVLPTGSRFSKNSQEREQMLFSRKEDLLKKARNNYVSRILNSSQARTEDSFDSSG